MSQQNPAALDPLEEMELSLRTEENLPEAEIYILLKGIERLFTEYIEHGIEFQRRFKSLLINLADSLEQYSHYWNTEIAATRKTLIDQIAAETPPEYEIELRIMLHRLEIGLGKLADHGAKLPFFEQITVRYLRLFADEIKPTARS